MSSGSGTIGRGANLIFLDCARLESSSEGRMEALRAGEFVMDLGGLIGDGVRRIDWRARLDIVFSGGDGLWKTGRRRRRRWRV